VVDLTVPGQIIVIVAGGLSLFVLRWLFIWSIQAIAKAIVTAINGQLGLDEIRNDVTLLKGQVVNLESQLEQILTDL
jgi:hypothetical protein